MNDSNSTLEKTQVRDIMSSVVEVCTPLTPVNEIAQQMKEHQVGAIPVLDPISRKPLGMVTDRDIVVNAVGAGRRCSKATAAEVMTTPAHCMPIDSTLESCAEAMAENQVRRLPLVNRKGACVGVVSLGDLVKRIDPQLAADVLLKIVNEKS